MCFEMFIHKLSRAASMPISLVNAMPLLPYIVQDTYSVPLLRILLYQPLQYLHATVCSAIINEYELTVVVSLFKNTPATLPDICFHIIDWNNY